MNSVQYEELCRLFLAEQTGLSVDDITSTHITAKVPTELEVYTHQIDLYWQTGDPVALYVNIANAKWRGTRKVEQGEVLLLEQVRNDIDAHKAVMITNSGFTHGAVGVAMNKGIALHIVKPTFDVSTIHQTDRSQMHKQLVNASATTRRAYSHSVEHRAFDLSQLKPGQSSSTTMQPEGGYTTRTVTDGSNRMGCGKTFHDAMLPYGGRLEHRHLSDSGVSLTEAYRQRAERRIASARAQHNRLPPIHFDYVNSPDLNAFAFKRDGLHFIGVTWGAFVLLRLLFMRMLADPNTFLAVGDRNLEAADLPLLEDMVPKRIELPPGSLGVGAPRDGARLEFAVMSFESAFSFLIRHEITHILHGHLAHPVVAEAGPFLTELGWTPTTEAACLTRQALEYDADRYAATGMGSAFLAYVSDPPAEVKGRQHSPREHMQHFFVGVGSMFRLFGDGRVADQDLGTVPYPPVRYRQYISMTRFCDHLKLAEGGALFGLSLNILEESYNAIEHAFPAFTKMELSIDGLREVVSPEGQAYIRVLHEKWERVRDQLLSHTYVEFQL